MIEYVKGKPYFCDTKKIGSFPYLHKDIECENLIIGGGIDGAITAYYFAENNLDTVLIEANRLGYMNTSCATALLEYQLDDFADDLKKYFSDEDIVNIYNIGLQSLDSIDKIIQELGNHCHYSKRDTLLYSDKSGDTKDMKKEFEFRKNNNFDVQYIDETNNNFPFKITSGIISKNGGAEFNPYLFEKQLIEHIKNKVKIYENTPANKIYRTNEGFEVLTNYGITIKAKNIICATGYNSEDFTSKKLCDKLISYTIVTSPIKEKLWENNTLIQDNMDPYHYMRISPDNRIILGGEDIPFKAIIEQQKADEIYEKLEQHLRSLFPNVKFTVDYKFAGAFSATNDNLSVIGDETEQPNLYYNLGYGANGIIYSIYGAKTIINLIKKKATLYLNLFTVNRKLP